MQLVASKCYFQIKGTRDPWGTHDCKTRGAKAQSELELGTAPHTRKQRTYRFSNSEAAFKGLKDKGDRLSQDPKEDNVKVDIDKNSSLLTSSIIFGGY